MIGEVSILRNAHADTEAQSPTGISPHILLGLAGPPPLRSDSDGMQTDTGGGPTTRCAADPPTPTEGGTTNGVPPSQAYSRVLDGMKGHGQPGAALGPPLGVNLRTAGQRSCALVALLLSPPLSVTPPHQDLPALLAGLAG